MELEGWLTLRTICGLLLTYLVITAMGEAATGGRGHGYKTVSGSRHQAAISSRSIHEGNTVRYLKVMLYKSISFPCRRYYYHKVHIEDYLDVTRQKNTELHIL